MMQKKLIPLILVVIVVVTAVYLFRTLRPTSLRAAQVFAWIKDPASEPGLAIAAGSRCGSAPFLFPTTGVAGFIWDDSFQVGHRHQGVDIFAGTDIDVA